MVKNTGTLSTLSLQKLDYSILICFLNGKTSGKATIVDTTNRPSVYITLPIPDTHNTWEKYSENSQRTLSIKLLQRTPYSKTI